MRAILGGLFLLTYAIFSMPASADPLLLKPPTPAGLVLPIALSIPQHVVPPRYLYEHGPFVACIVYDIGTDGHVSNINLLVSSGDPLIDKGATTQSEGMIYQPATLNGVPVAVRSLSVRYFVFGDSPKPPAPCSWDTYRATDAKPDK